MIVLVHQPFSTVVQADGRNHQIVGVVGDSLDLDEIVVTALLAGLDDGYVSLPQPQDEEQPVTMAKPRSAKARTRAVADAPHT